MNTGQLQVNVNMYALQPTFLNDELHYVIAVDENNFRFTKWDEEPVKDEQKFYCFLVEKELYIPAGDITLEECYALRDHPLYETACDAGDFIKAIKKTAEDGVSKLIRRFYDSDIDIIADTLAQSCGLIEKHVVISNQGGHLLLVMDTIEISVSAAMVYFRKKTSFAEKHYEDMNNQQHETTQGS